MPVACPYAIGMDTETDAVSILHDAERSLRGLIERRLKEQRYADVATIARYADGLAGLLQHPTRFALAPSAEGEPPVPVITRSARLATETPHRPKPPKKKEYPRFVREGDRLVKIGWSKKNKSTYEHKAPYESVTAVVRQLASRVTPRQVFTIEDIVPVPDISNDGEVPVYQLYLTLAWLRDLGLLSRQGRDRYVADHPTQLPSGIHTYWNELVE